MLKPVTLAVIVSAAVSPALGQVSNLALLDAGSTGMENSLWVETPPIRQFETTTSVECANIQGPGEITMMHFAYPQADIATTHVLGRELLLRIYWDDETQPSVDCPMVDFFCDPAGLRQIVNTAMVNKCRGFNTYFPMPFRKSARVVLEYDGPLKPGNELWANMPCYGYVMYNRKPQLSADAGYFHAHWRREILKLGSRDYTALEATGRGKFVGWNVTVRWPGRGGYPVDMNENYYIDGETSPSLEFQGIEDSFGYSWGFPEKENLFPLTGWFPHMEGAAAYRFFLSDSISFQKSLRVTIGFGHGEPGFARQFSTFGSSLELATTCYWYQTEPHAAYEPMPAAADRNPCPSELFFPEKEDIPTSAVLESRGVKLLMYCGHPRREVVYAAPGFGVLGVDGFAYDGFPGQDFYCRASGTELVLELQAPEESSGTLRLFIQDPDLFQGGRRQRLSINERVLGEFEHFEKGQWVEATIAPDDFVDGKLMIHAVNLHAPANAVISKIEWISAP